MDTPKLEMVTIGHSTQVGFVSFELTIGSDLTCTFEVEYDNADNADFDPAWIAQQFGATPPEGDGYVEFTITPSATTVTGIIAEVRQTLRDRYQFDEFRLWYDVPDIDGQIIVDLMADGSIVVNLREVQDKYSEERLAHIKQALYDSLLVNTMAPTTEIGLASAITLEAPPTDPDELLARYLQIVTYFHTTP